MGQVPMRRSNAHLVMRYCKCVYVVPRGCQSYVVGVFGLERERISIYGYVDCRELVGVHEGCCPVHLCVLIAK